MGGLSGHLNVHLMFDRGFWVLEMSPKSDLLIGASVLLYVSAVVNATDTWESLLSLELSFECDSPAGALVVLEPSDVAEAPGG